MEATSLGTPGTDGVPSPAREQQAIAGGGRIAMVEEEKGRVGPKSPAASEKHHLSGSQTPHAQHSSVLGSPKASSTRNSTQHSRQNAPER